MAFTPKAWKAKPDPSTPLSAAAMIDLETRLSSYTDSMGAAGAGVIYTEPGGTPPDPASYPAGTLWIEITE